MSPSLRTPSLFALGLIAALGLSISAVQAGQDRRGSGRGQGRRAPADVSEKSAFFRICDHDHDKWISFREANYSLLLDRGRFQRIDTDSDGGITRQEFDAYYDETVERTGAFRDPVPMDLGQTDSAQNDQTKRADPKEDKGPVDSAQVLKLFGAQIQRSDKNDLLSLPPRIRGPVHHFARLDIDEDGQITVKDLELLARPIQLDVRLSAVIAILDSDDDGGVSLAEFDASMR